MKQLKEKNTTITVSKENRRKLNVIKQHLGFYSINDLISKILSIIRKFKLEKELE